MNSESSDDAAENLNEIVDDQVASRECHEWIVEQLDLGNDPETLISQLVVNGWSEDQARHLVDAAVRTTRNGRGAMAARNKVARSFIRSRKPHLFHSFHRDASAGAGAAALFSLAILSVGRLVEKLVSRKTREIRYRQRHGLCHSCGADITTSRDACPSCNAVIVRRKL
jgi:lipopolysaccharide biosynthesis regulator YciM